MVPVEFFVLFSFFFKLWDGNGFVMESDFDASSFFLFFSLFLFPLSFVIDLPRRLI